MPSKPLDVERGAVVTRDEAAEAWLVAQHSLDWYIGNATEDEWRFAYAAVDEGTIHAGEVGMQRARTDAIQSAHRRPL